MKVVRRNRENWDELPPECPECKEVKNPNKGTWLRWPGWAAPGHIYVWVFVCRKCAWATAASKAAWKQIGEECERENRELRQTVEEGEREERGRILRERAEQEAANKKEGVYLIADGTGKVKIGKFSEDPKRRLRTLQTGNSNVLELLDHVFCEDANEAENELHEKYDHLRVRGEWFTHAPEISLDSLKQEGAQWLLSSR